ncbi:MULTISPECIES: hypothetical protein [Collinsella]|uniref:DUF3168 domain-containing protein n=1 Tax=Collinsella ihumii TaxID=1720204 RepID=A0ABT7XFL1_9ACTN|nr:MULTISPECIES: hypothetical protein [Collinsella]MDN0055624.1 hypothetical protein [Collinsella ihumii]MDN0064207.1 hypothetical protein [Collinsella ihumii]OUO61502.1 hypothetical protein B5F74_05090 [Collinsella sp. An271]
MATEALEPVDVESALAADLAASGITVTAPPVPEELGERLPLASALRIGGTRINPYVDSHSVTFSVWAGTWASAVATADRLAGAVARLPQTEGSSVHWREASITLLPHIAPDPAHPTVPRAQFTATVTCRTTR